MFSRGFCRAAVSSRRGAAKFYSSTARLAADKCATPVVAAALVGASLLFAATADHSPSKPELFRSVFAPAVASCADAPMPVYGIPGTNHERTFLAVKPDGVQRGLVGDIIARFEKRGYKLVGLKMVWPTPELAADHYADLSTKKFFPALINFFSSGPIVAMCWEGKDIITQGRQMLGETQPLASKPGSIRGDYSIDLGRNICHGSDSPEAAKKELEMWFPEGVNDWAKTVDTWVYE
jgi:nucleoside-diphosphate kinase